MFCYLVSYNLGGIKRVGYGFPVYYLMAVYQAAAIVNISMIMNLMAAHLSDIMPGVHSYFYIQAFIMAELPLSIAIIV